MVGILLVLHLCMWGAASATQALVIDEGLRLPPASNEPRTSAVQKHIVKQQAQKSSVRKTLRGKEMTQAQKEEAEAKAAARAKLDREKAKLVAERRALAQKQSLAKRELAEKEEKRRKLRARWKEVQEEAKAPEEVREKLKKERQAAEKAAKKAALEENMKAEQKQLQKVERMRKYREVLHEKKKAMALKERADEAKVQRAAEYRAKQLAVKQTRTAKEQELADPVRKAKEAALKHQRALAADSLSMTMKVDGQKEVQLKVDKNSHAYILLPTAAHLLHVEDAKVRLKHGEAELSLSETMGRQGLKEGDVITATVS